MKKIFVFVLMVLLLSTPLFARSLELGWENPTTYITGNALTPEQIAALQIVVERKAPNETEYSVLVILPSGTVTYTDDISVYNEGSKIAYRVKAVLGTKPSRYSYELIYTIPEETVSEATKLVGNEVK